MSPTFLGLRLSAITLALSTLHLACALPNALSRSSRAHTSNLQARDGHVVKKWTAMGDSYASGIGAGSRKGDSGDQTCSRYTEAYPNVMNVVLDGAGPDTREFFDLACSGAVTTAVRDNQAGSFTRDIDIATLSVGGNDIGFFDIINNCIFQFYITATCEEQIQITQGKIDSDEFHSNLDSVISRILGNAQASQFRLYMSGYTHFWNVDTTQCNGVTWSYWKRQNPPNLTQELRSSLNTLTSNLNQAISDAVDRANPGDPRQPVVFVDYSAAFNGHRYCEDGVNEPDPNRADTWLFEWDTTEAITTTETDFPPGSIEALYAGWIDQQKAADPSLVVASQGSHWVVDSLAKVFHPRIDGHNAIKDIHLNAYQSNPPRWGQFTPGWCGMHVVQHQKPNPATDNYSFDVTIKDAKDLTIGELQGANVATGQSVDVTSRLPYVLTLTAGAIDDDAVLFAYGDQHWGSNDQEHHCDFGAYDSGARQGDCGFSC